MTWQPFSADEPPAASCAAVLMPAAVSARSRCRRRNSTHAAASSVVSRLMSMPPKDAYHVDVFSVVLTAPGVDLLQRFPSGV